ncbi:apoptosis-associated speck-like protein containing a CARD [Varanus komodoensis]|uniref:apoptosis-associated speck-like protein containing a CARD n=1 Tax=Varanus komodoensis TaxID=61221 RepID=UPI001CF7C01A|nr:apoptosis-associated speck-like protein containing a CARD [Varanus komodoensis]
MGDAAQPFETALLFALDDLAGDNFRRFKQQLGVVRVEEGRARIPRGRLERADTLDAARLLLEAYGEEGALDVAVRALRGANLRDSASALLQWRRGEQR